ncbi:hypothetical protein LCGC14_2340260, partial [marine sediment metagenome]
MMIWWLPVEISASSVASWPVPLMNLRVIVGVLPEGLRPKPAAERWAGTLRWSSPCWRRRSVAVNMPHSSMAETADKKPRGMIRRFVFPVVRVAALSYLAVVALVWALQSRLVYMPEPDTGITPADLGVRYEDVRLRAGDGTKLSAWYVPARKPKGVILFCHGNGGNISHRMESIAIFCKLGYSVLIFDYRGYGKSEGKPTEAGTYDDARAAWDYLVGERKLPPEE